MRLPSFGARDRNLLTISLRLRSALHIPQPFTECIIGPWKAADCSHYRLYTYNRRCALSWDDRHVRPLRRATWLPPKQRLLLRASHETLEIAVNHVQFQLHGSETASAFCAFVARLLSTDVGLVPECAFSRLHLPSPT